MSCLISLIVLTDHQICFLLEDFLEPTISTDDIAAIERFLLASFDRGFARNGLLRRESPRRCTDTERPRIVRARNLVLKVVLRMPQHAKVLLPPYVF